MEILSAVLSVLSLLLFMISFLIKGTNMKNILLFNTSGNFLMMVSYLCVYNMNGALSSTVGMLVGAINVFFARKKKKIPIWVLMTYALAFIAVNAVAWSSWVDLFAIAAALAAVFSICAASGKGYRIWSLANDVLWTVFDILRGSYGPLLTHGALIGFTLAGMIIHDKKGGKLHVENK